MKFLDKLFGPEFPRTHEIETDKGSVKYFFGVRNAGTKFGSMDHIYGDLYIDKMSEINDVIPYDVTNGYVGKAGSQASRAVRVKVLDRKDVLLTPREKPFKESISGLADNLQDFSNEEATSLFQVVRDAYVKKVEEHWSV